MAVRLRPDSGRSEKGKRLNPARLSGIIRTTRLNLVGLVALAATALAACVSGPTPGEAFTGDIERASLTHDGMDRTYFVVDGAAAGEPAALVVALHGADVTSVEAFVDETGWHEKAMEVGAIVVFPEGTASGRRLGWNAIACCGAAQSDGLDDKGFVLAVVDDVMESRNVDIDRVYLTGKSNGAMLTSQIIAGHGDRFAAGAMVVGTVFEGAITPGAPTPMMLVSTQDDPVIPHEPGARPGIVGRLLFDLPALGAVQSAAWWVDRNRASKSPERTDSGAGYRELYRATDGGSEVLFVSLAEGGHTWPRGEFDATDEIWAFFERQ